MIRTYMLFAMLLLLAVPVEAQKRLVVVDVETGVPIRGVNVVSSSTLRPSSSTFHQADTTDWQGAVTIPDTCRTLIFSHVNYESYIINAGEVKNDTVFLISKLMGLPEVTVFGRGKGEDRLKELKKQMRIDKTEMQLTAADPAAGGNITGLFKMVAKLFKRPKESRKEKLRCMLEEY